MNSLQGRPSWVSSLYREGGWVRDTVIWDLNPPRLQSALKRNGQWFCGKELACQCRRHKRREFDPWVEKIPWRRAWQPTPVFLPTGSCARSSLAGYSSWGHRVGHDWSDLASMRAVHCGWGRGCVMWELLKRKGKNIPQWEQPKPSTTRAE